MNKEQIHEKVIAILKKYTRQPEVWATATNSSKIISDLKINSARIVDITLDFEDTFDIAIDNADMDRIITIENAIDVITELLSK